MKKIIIATMALIFTMSAHAAFFTCEADSESHGNEGSNSQVLLGEYHEMSCHAYQVKKGVLKEAGDYTVLVYGPGLGLRIDQSEIVLNCPTAALKNIEKADFYGLKVSASAVIGATAGVFVSKRLGSCLLTGINLGIGAGIAGVKLEFEKKSE